MESVCEKQTELPSRSRRKKVDRIVTPYVCYYLNFWQTPANGLRYLRVGGCGQGLGAGKARSQKNASKPRRLPHVRCTLC